MRCRLIDSGAGQAFWNMGADESILHHVSLGKSPATLRLYAWTPSAVSIGYFQSIRSEVDLDECFRSGVDVVRRITGGGAVFHDKEITYSFIAPEDSVPDDILKSYMLICSGLTKGLKSLGIKAEFAPLNDIVAGGKKISGNAQTRRMGCILQHGTLLLDLDTERMFRYLTVPPEKTREKAAAGAKERVTSAAAVLMHEVTYNKAAEALKKGFAEALGLKLEAGSLSEGEAALAKELAETKYSTLEWNGKR
jgi:lipoate-protein ligase A